MWEDPIAVLRIKIKIIFINNAQGIISKFMGILQGVSH